MQTKQHVKLYKSGKMWVGALVGAAAIASGAGMVSADTTTVQASQPKTVQTNAATKATSTSTAVASKQTTTNTTAVTPDQTKSATTTSKQTPAASQKTNTTSAATSTDTNNQVTAKSNATDQSQASATTDDSKNQATTKAPATTDDSKNQATTKAPAATDDSTKQTATKTPVNSDDANNQDSTKPTSDDNDSSNVTKAGWQGNKYFKDGVALTGMQKISGKWYLFDKNGQATVGLYTNGKNKQYYQDDFSQLRNQQLKINHSTIYYFGKDGSAIQGLRQYTDKKGVQHVEAYDSKSFKQIQNGYFRANAKDLYFLGADGQAVAGLRNYTNKKGVKRLEAYNTKTFKQIRNAYFKTNGGKNLYFLGKNGDAVAGLRNYTDKKGNKQLEAYNTKSFKQIRNAYFRANAKDLYFLGKNGDAVVGLRNYTDKKGKQQLEAYSKKTFKQVRSAYYKTNSGKNVYYLGKNGNAVKGARYVGKDVEYYGSNFKQVKNTWKTFNNTQYYFGSKGVATKALLNYRYYSQLNQGAPEGCEGASMQIALSHKGRNVPSLPSIYKKIGYGYGLKSPHQGFYGNPFGGGGRKTETVFADAISKTFKKLGAHDLTGATTKDVIKELNHGNALVTWADIAWQLTGRHTFHVMSIVGYNADSFLIADPYAYSPKSLWVSQKTWAYVNKNTKALGFKTPHSMNMVIR